MTHHLITAKFNHVKNCNAMSVCAQHRVDPFSGLVLSKTLALTDAQTTYHLMLHDGKLEAACSAAPC
jgi:hypothetical protein